MTANTAQEKPSRTPRTSSRSARQAHDAKVLVVSRPATQKQIAEMREQLIWLRDHGFTFSMLEHDTGKSGGWCHKVINDRDRYTVTSIDVAVIRASHRSAFRMHGREQHKYKLMQSIIVKAGGIMRDVEDLAGEA